MDPQPARPGSYPQGQAPVWAQISRAEKWVVTRALPSSEALNTDEFTERGIPWKGRIYPRNINVVAPWQSDAGAVEKARPAARAPSERCTERRRAILHVAMGSNSTPQMS